MNSGSRRRDKDAAREHLRILREKARVPTAHKQPLRFAATKRGCLWHQTPLRFAATKHGCLGTWQPMQEIKSSPKQSGRISHTCAELVEASKKPPARDYPISTYFTNFIHPLAHENFLNDL